MKRYKFVLILLIGMLVQAKADTINFWHVYYNETKIVEFHLGSYGEAYRNPDGRYFSLSGNPARDTLYRIHPGEVYELGVPCGYVNQQGDTVMPIGKYHYCFFDTVITFAIVADPSGVFAVDLEENRLYEVYWFDNGIDYIRDGLFRIMRHGKIGYANEQGVIIIAPQFACSNPFENGRAKVAYECELIKEGDYTLMRSTGWFYIDTSGNKIE